MGVQRTRTIKSKHATNRSGIKNSKLADKARPDPVVKSKSRQPKSNNAVTQASKGGASKLAELLKKRNKKKVYSEKELGLPQLNTITPVGVQKPKGKKKGKVFVDDRESMTTILSMVQAEKQGQIESKIMKQRYMEEIREARRLEAEKKEAERTAKFDETKDSLRKKRTRTPKPGSDEASIKGLTLTGTKAAKPKKRKVSFAT